MPKAKSSSNRKVQFKEDLKENLEWKTDLDNFGATEEKNEAPRMHRLSSELFFSPSTRKASTFYNIVAPREIYSFIYKFEQESRKQSTGIRQKNLPDDLPLPEPVSQESDTISGP